MEEATQSGVSFCRVGSDGWGICSSANLSSNGISYQRVCGRARGYQKGDTLAFCVCNYGGDFHKISGSYVSGLSITYGNPRQHIWPLLVDVVKNIIIV